MEERYLTARDAATMLGISLPTLYAYVSRGLIRSAEIGDSRHRRGYVAEDVQRLKNRQDVRRDPETATTHAMHWGMPVLDSALTRIADGALYYRGREVTELAMTRTLEEVAALLWTGEMTDADEIFRAAPPIALVRERLARLGGEYPPLQRFALALDLALHDDLAAYDQDNATRTGASILKLLAGLLAATDDVSAPIAQIVQGAWLPERPAVVALLNAALILCADHELNTSSFAARVVASTGANLYLVIQAGLAAVQGHRHGGHMLLVEEWLSLVATPERVRGQIAARLQRGECVPGFYPHRLYPAGDPRGKLLMRLLAEHFPEHPAVQLAQQIAATMQAISQKSPTIDFALPVLCLALELPPASSVALFALARSVGWIAHALEQYQSGALIRPRARYVGE